jgi:hypothetical protein
MKTYTLSDPPLQVFGAPLFESEGSLARLPDDLIAQLPLLTHYGRRCPGGRVAFKTDSPTFTVKVALKTLSVDIGMSVYACQSAQVMLGERATARHLGVVNPPDYRTKIFEKSFKKSPVMEQITVYFPRNEIIDFIEISVTDDANVAPPTPYAYEKPVVFYGSSITEGGCCCNVTNAYNAMLSRWLDFDYINLGFSGSAMGEPVMADYIAAMDMSAFVFDYDHNAPSIKHLAATHKPFFDRIRAAHPNLPILMMTRPAEVYTSDYKARREVVRATYEAAIAAGDNNVYFIDGETFYGDTDRNLCASDDCHPNDLGFYRMASVIRPVLEKMLKSAE